MAKASIHVRRNSPRDIKVRGLEVYIDGKFVANLQFGRAVRFAVDPGEHELKVTNSLYTKTETVSLAEGEESRFLAGNHVTGLFAPMFLAVGVGPYRVFLEPDTGEA